MWCCVWKWCFYQLNFGCVYVHSFLLLYYDDDTHIFTSKRNRERKFEEKKLNWIKWFILFCCQNVFLLLHFSDAVFLYNILQVLSIKIYYIYVEKSIYICIQFVFLYFPCVYNFFFLFFSGYANTHAMPSVFLWDKWYKLNDKFSVNCCRNASDIIN